MKNIEDQELWDAISLSLKELEDKDEIVILSGNNRNATHKIYNTLTDVLPHTSLSASELSGLKSLTSHAINDKKFFDWEMPTLTGFNIEGFKKIIKKLPTV